MRMITPKEAFVLQVAVMYCKGRHATENSVTSAAFAKSDGDQFAGPLAVKSEIDRLVGLGLMERLVGDQVAVTQQGYRTALVAHDLFFPQIYERNQLEKSAGEYKLITR